MEKKSDLYINIISQPFHADLLEINKLIYIIIAL